MLDDLNHQSKYSLVPDTLLVELAEVRDRLARVERALLMFCDALAGRHLADADDTPCEGEVQP
jgi:hypothetical protein